MAKLTDEGENALPAVYSSLHLRRGLQKVTRAPGGRLLASSRQREAAAFWKARDYNIVAQDTANDLHVPSRLQFAADPALAPFLERA
jgi:hypothetical protein